MAARELVHEVVRGLNPRGSTSHSSSRNFIVLFFNKAPLQTISLRSYNAGAGRIGWFPDLDLTDLSDAASHGVVGVGYETVDRALVPLSHNGSYTKIVEVTGYALRNACYARKHIRLYGHPYPSKTKRTLHRNGAKCSYRVHKFIILGSLRVQLPTTADSSSAIGKTSHLVHGCNNRYLDRLNPL